MKLVRSIMERANALPRELQTDGDMNMSAHMNELLAACEQAQVQMEDALEQIEWFVEKAHSYRSLFDEGPDGFALTNVEGVIKETNVSLCELLHVANNVLIGKPISVFLDSTGRHELSEILAAFIRDEMSRLSDWEVKFKPRNGQSFICSVSIVASPNLEEPFGGAIASFKNLNRGKGKEDESADGQTHGKSINLRWMIRDITKRKQNETALKLYSQKLAESNRALEQFAYVAAHDLQEPLRIMALYCQLLEESFDRGTMAENRDTGLWLSYVSTASKKARSLVQDLLIYSKMSAPQEDPVSVDLNKLIEQIVQEFQLMIEENKAKISCEKLPEVLGFPQQLSVLFSNLLSNAIKFHSDSPPEVSISGKRTEDAVVISVRDNGMGIESADRETVFAMFKRLHPNDERFPGNGIGLALCHKIVQNHSGRIWVRANDQNGCTFCVSLPSQFAGGGAGATN